MSGSILGVINPAFLAEDSFTSGTAERASSTSSGGGLNSQRSHSLTEPQMQAQVQSLPEFAVKSG